MANQISEINPKILQWARLRSGLSLKEVALVFKKNVEIIENWEKGSEFPTYVQLEKLAYQLYKRPIALFFFPVIPEEEDPKESFRTLPEFEKEKLSSDTILSLRQALAMQISLNELCDGTNPSKQRIFEDISLTNNSDLSDTTEKVREYLSIPLETQTKWRNSDIAFKNWRAAVEKCGIFVFKRSFKQRNVSGFCLYDNKFPIIYINNSTSDTKQIFTLFHELCHILLKSNGITQDDNSYIDDLTGFEKSIEIFSNQFASEFLVPNKDFNNRIKSVDISEEYIERLSKIYCVSRSVILRKLLDRNIISRSFYETKTAEWDKQYFDHKSKKSGGNYYSTQATYLGESYLNLAFRRYYQGRCSIEQLADHLNIKIKNIPNLENIVLAKS